MGRQYHLILEWNYTNLTISKATVVSILSTSTIFVQKTPDGQRSKYWRLDVRGSNNCVRVCDHNKRRFNTGGLARMTG